MVDQESIRCCATVVCYNGFEPHILWFSQKVASPIFLQFSFYLKIKLINP